MSTIVAALRKRSARESRDDEIEEVDLVRATTSVAKARNELLAERIDGRSLDEEAEERAAAAYAGYRALSDFELLAPPLLHPGEWLLGTDLAQRPELLALDRLSIVHVEAAFRNAADRLHDRRPKTSRARRSPIARKSTARGRQSSSTRAWPPSAGSGRSSRRHSMIACWVSSTTAFDAFARA